MATVGFFTAVNFVHKTCVESVLEAADNYFFLGGEKAFAYSAITPEQVVLMEESPEFWVTAFKVASYFTVILPVIMLTVKVILRSIYSFQIVDVKAMLETGIDISQETLEEIRAVMPTIQAEGRKGNPKIRWYIDENKVFTLHSNNELIFKMVPPEQSEQYFENIIKAHKVCLVYGLGLLTIPHAKQFDVDGITFIAEQQMPIRQSLNERGQAFRQLAASNSDRTIRELAIFIAKTSWSNVDWGNMPILSSGSGNIALISLKEMEDAKMGIFGRCDPFRRGLVNCLFSEQQIDIALEEARYHGVIGDARLAERVKAARMAELRLS